MDSRLETELHRVLEGYDKTINSLKQRGLMKINEGKQDLKAGGFGAVAFMLMTLKPVKKGQKWCIMSFGWRFFVVMWNLMRTADSLDKIMLQHMESGLVVEEQGHKGDQTGTENFCKHVYANPYEPSKGTILALAVHLFSCPERCVGAAIYRQRQQISI